MKDFIILFSLFFVIASYSQAEVCHPEAQFHGTVTNLTTYPAQGEAPASYTYQIRLGQSGNIFFLPRIGCVLSSSAFDQAIIREVGEPTLKDGDFISGILVYDESLDSFTVLAD